MREPQQKAQSQDPLTEADRAEKAKRSEITNQAAKANRKGSSDISYAG
jgi:hypothetical protein